jgi:penicillin amidase
VIKSSSEFTTESYRPTELPHVENPPSGFIASANNRPLKTEFELAQTYARSDRADRLQQLIKARMSQRPLFRPDLDFLKQLQLDSVSESSREIAHQLAAVWPEHPLTTTLLQWDGSYEITERAPVIFEVALAHFDELTQPKKTEVSDRLFKDLKSRIQEKLRSARLTRTEDPQDFPRTLSLIMEVFERTRKTLEGEDSTWGDYHRQALQTPLGAIPWIGGRYRRGEFPAPGSNDTLNKSGHPVSTEPAQVTYGAQSRHLSRLSELDANHFVLLGGQDGWLWNPQIDDQVNLWRQGQYFLFPLSKAGIQQQFNTRQTRFMRVTK